jgi:glycosyltransferase involved in cell wall biosynthesis
VVYESEMEGLGSAALLAQSAGVPVVASRIGGLPEAIADGETGILVDGSQEIAPAVRSLLDDAERLDRFSRAARLRIEAQFTVERMVTRTLEEYARALA